MNGLVKEVEKIVISRDVNTIKKLASKIIDAADKNGNISSVTVSEIATKMIRELAR